MCSVQRYLFFFSQRRKVRRDICRNEKSIFSQRKCAKCAETKSACFCFLAEAQSAQRYLLIFSQRPQSAQRYFVLFLARGAGAECAEVRRGLFFFLQRRKVFFFSQRRKVRTGGACLFSRRGTKCAEIFANFLAETLSAQRYLFFFSQRRTQSAQRGIC